MYQILYQRSLNKKSILYFLLFCIQPFCALIVYLFTLSKTVSNKFDIFITTLIISLLGIYWYPFGDPQTHFAIYYADVVERFYSFSIFNSNYIYDYILTVISKLFGNYVWGYFFWIFVPLLLYNISIWNFAQKYKYCSLIFIALFLFIGCREVLDLNRNAAAALILASGLITKKKFYSIVFIIFACLLHSSVLILTIVWLMLFPIYHFLTSKRLLIIYPFCFILSLISPLLIGTFASERLVDMYITGNAGAGVTVPSGFFYLMTVVNILIFIVILVITAISYNKIKNTKYINLFNFYFVSSVITLGTWFLWTMRERFLLINCILGFAIIIIYWYKITPFLSLNNIRLIKLIVILSLFRFGLIL